MALPITQLTLRAFQGGKAVRVVGLFALVPVLFAAIYVLDAGGVTRREFINDIFQEFIAPTILPIAILILGTNALGNELEDRTMVYLVLKPISRARIIVEKFLAVFLTGSVLLAIGTAITWLLVVRGEAGDNLDILAAAIIAVLFAVAGYGALFLAVSLIIPRALLVGIIYALVWETTFARFLPGVRMAAPEGTYLGWLDCTGAGIPGGDPFTFFLERARVALNDGAAFAAPGFVRLNFGCPRATLTAALDRMREALVGLHRAS
jgi:ABC-type transport system involved in multi-copper enzyme maturation permease subunit